jgi:hypothetical protein
MSTTRDDVHDFLLRLILDRCIFGARCTQVGEQLRGWAGDHYQPEHLQDTWFQMNIFTVCREHSSRCFLAQVRISTTNNASYPHEDTTTVTGRGGNGSVLFG